MTLEGGLQTGEETFSAVLRRPMKARRMSAPRLAGRSWLDGACVWRLTSGEVDILDRLAPKVIVDHSTSMNHSRAGRTRMESVAEGAMALRLACTALGIDHRVTVTPQQTDLAYLESGERGKARIAGLASANRWEAESHD